MSTLPTTIDAYLQALSTSLAGADPALIQDALYDAEEFLRGELAENAGKNEAEVIAKVASSYGAPDEVAAIYRDTEYKVRRAIEPPRAVTRSSALGKFFGVLFEPRTYGALFYMLLSVATGIVYFTFAVSGLSLSLGLSLLIIGLPVFLLFLGMTRVLSLVEGRIVETMLGVRMPRRPLYTDRSAGLMARIKEMITDARTWSTILYLVLMLPLGILYFTLASTGLSLSLGLIAAPILWMLVWTGWANGSIEMDGVQIGFGVFEIPPAVGLPLTFAVGVLLLFAMLHLARGVAHVHGAIARQLLVHSGSDR